MSGQLILNSKKCHRVRTAVYLLGIVNCLRAHLPSVAAMTAPLDALCNKEAIIVQDWAPRPEKQFLLTKQIRQQLQMATILRYTDPNLLFHVAIDASNNDTIGAALYQTINDKE